MPTMPANLPNFDDLPLVKGLPKGCAWGIFDDNGEKDTLGTLNLLDEEIVRTAAKEITVGQSISLKYVI